MTERTEKNLLVVPGHGVCRKRHTGLLSEAEQTDSWVGIFELEIARDANWWGFPGVGLRTATEKRARDRFGNLLFGIALSRRDVGTRPVRITVVGWCFKEKRYELHRRALKWPKDRFDEYAGVNDPAGEALQAAVDGEKKRESVSRGLLLTGPGWVSQRELRSPFRQHQP